MQLESVSQLYSIFLQHPVVCTDSRNCPSGSVFFALKGDRFNANAYALSALEQGCAYAVINEKQYELDDRFILVDDVLKALQRLASFHRRQLGIPVIGITGTNGKTTTKELTAAVLKQKFNVLYTQGNLNNHIGVPVTLLQLTSAHEIAIVEMGANHPGEIKTLCEIARPDFGLITNVGKGHLEGFGSFEGVVRTKAELYGYIAKQGKFVFINKENDLLTEMALQASLSDRMIAYPEGKAVSASPFLKMECIINSQRVEIDTNLIGQYNAENVRAAVAVGGFFGVPGESVKKGIESYVPQNNRSQLVETGKNRLIVDAYNANPTSMTLAINNFAQIEAQNKLLILGDMLELGDQSEAEHRKILNLLSENELDNALLVGSQFSKVAKEQFTFEDVFQLIEYIKAKDYKDYTVLIKGSRGIKLEKVIENL